MHSVRCPSAGDMLCLGWGSEPWFFSVHPDEIPWLAIRTVDWNFFLDPLFCLEDMDWLSGRSRVECRPCHVVSVPKGTVECTGLHEQGRGGVHIIANVGVQAWNTLTLILELTKLYEYMELEVHSTASSPTPPFCHTDAMRNEMQRRHIGCQFIHRISFGLYRACGSSIVTGKSPSNSLRMTEASTTA